MVNYLSAPAEEVAVGRMPVDAFDELCYDYREAVRARDAAKMQEILAKLRRATASDLPDEELGRAALLAVHQHIDESPLRGSTH